MIQPPGDCPVCKRVDLIQKVSAIYRDSFSTTMETQMTAIYDSEGNPTYNSTIVPVTRQTKLGILLKPPQPKTFRLPTVELIILSTSPFLFVIGLVISINLNIVYNVNMSRLSCGLAIGLPILLPLLAHWVIFRRANERRRELKQQEQERCQYLTERWALFCYCHRCDCVFFPGEEKAAPPEQMELLYTSVP